MDERRMTTAELAGVMRERPKELICLYTVETILQEPSRQLGDSMEQVVRVLPAGMQYTDHCEAEIHLEGRIYRSGEFAPTSWVLAAPIMVHRRVVGELRIYYLTEKPSADYGPFLIEEQCLLRRLVERLSRYLIVRSDSGAGTSAPECRSGRAVLVDQAETSPVSRERRSTASPVQSEHGAWREHMVEGLATAIDADESGVVALYIFGSVKNGNAGPGSDIDLLVHFRGTEEQRVALMRWFTGWSEALAAMNYLRTGYRSDGLLDVHVLTDDDIAAKTSYAVKIGAITDAARPLQIRDPKVPGT